MSWSDEFQDPIPGFKTFQDAADHIQMPTEAQQKLPHWQGAVEALIIAAEDRGSPLIEETHWGTVLFWDYNTGRNSSWANFHQATDVGKPNFSGQRT